MSTERVALVVGAGGFLGQKISIELARHKISLVLQSKTKKSLDSLYDTMSHELQDDYISPLLVPLELSNKAGIVELGVRLYERYEKLDMLVILSSFLNQLTPLTHMTDKAWDEVIDVNLSAPFRIIRSMTPLLKISTNARVVFTGCRLGEGEAYWGAYTAAARGMESLIQTYIKETAKVTNINVKTIYPTRMPSSLYKKAFPNHYENPSFKIEDIVKEYMDFLLV